MGVPGRKFEIIHEVVSQDNNKLTITELCNIAGVSRSGYYRWLNSYESRKLRDERDIHEWTEQDIYEHIRKMAQNLI